jgi:hypothetical protein
MLAYLQTIEGEIMNKWQFMLVVAVAMVAGLIGGALSDRLAIAKGSKVAKVNALRAKSIYVDHLLANDISIVDSSTRKARGAWTNAGIMLLDSNSKPKLGLMIQSGRPGLSMRGANGHNQLLINIDKKSGASIILSDNRQNTRAVLGCENAGSALSLYDDKGQVRAAMGVLKTDKSRTKSAWPHVILFDEQGNAIWNAKQ